MRSPFGYFLFGAAALHLAFLSYSPPSPRLAGPTPGGAGEIAVEIRLQPTPSRAQASPASKALPGVAQTVATIDQAAVADAPQDYSSDRRKAAITLTQGETPSTRPTLPTDPRLEARFNPSSDAPLEQQGDTHEQLELTVASRGMQIEQALSRHFHYPPLARRNGWQGLVRLGVHIEANGLLSHIEVVQSSGYRALDRAAIASLKKVARLPTDRGLGPQGIDLVIPVEYRLMDS